MSSVLAGLDIAAFIGPLMNMILYGTLGLGLVMVFGAAYWMMMFNIKVEIISLVGSTKDGVFVLGKTRKNRVRYVNNRTEWRSLWPLFNKKSIEPFEDQYIQDKRNIRAFEIGELWVPCAAQVKAEGGDWSATLMPVPHYIRNWQSLTHKKHNFEFAQHNFWEDNKTLIMAVIAVGLCLVLCGVTVWLTYKYAAPNTATWNQLTDALKNINVVQGVGPR